VIALGGVLAILAMAGPAWRKLDVPVFRQQSSLVVAFDLSRSMDAQDIEPSRIERAKLKLTDILRRQKEGQTALIVFAADAFAVSPLTTDANTIISQLQSFSTGLMPAQGSRPDLAVVKGEGLLKQAGSANGGILLITDGIDRDKHDELEKAAGHLRKAGYRLSIMGVGTPQGAPIPAPDGGFVQDDNGAIVLPGLDESFLEKIAREGGGTYRRLSADDSDIDTLLPSVQGVLGPQQGAQAKGLTSDQWRDEGPWLLLPLLLLGMLAFRRGYWLALLLIALQPIRQAHAMDWNSLWLNSDQRGQRALEAKQPQQAATLFRDPDWRAAAEYKAGNYQAALKDLKDASTPEALYNRGNALAQAGKLTEAIDAYDEALKKNPKLKDAEYNRDLLKKMMQQQQQQQKKDGSKASDQPSSSKNGKSAQQDQKPSSSQSGKSSSDTEKNGEKENRDSSQKPSGNPQSDSEKNSEKSNASPENEQQQPSGTQPQNKQSGTQPEQQKADAKNGSTPQAAAEEQQTPDEKTQAEKHWLQRIPDDPGGLWRNKFLYQYKQQGQRSDKQSW
jgi:Ca-activated chloride channel homolog